MRTRIYGIPANDVHVYALNEILHTHTCMQSGQREWRTKKGAGPILVGIYKTTEAHIHTTFFVFFSCRRRIYFFLSFRCKCVSYRHCVIEFSSIFTSLYLLPLPCFFLSFWEFHAMAIIKMQQLSFFKVLLFNDVYLSLMHAVNRVIEQNK